MMKYHGTPFGGSNQEAAEALIGRHAFVSFAAQQQLEVALEVCQSVALDNGAYSAWKGGKPIEWDDYFKWVERYLHHPRIDWAVIPDVIDGDEAANQALLDRWALWFGPAAKTFGVPVWHMHESAEKLLALTEEYPRVAFGSSAEYAAVGCEAWHKRMNWAMRLICANGRPRAKIHMLRGLNPDVFSRYPFASADSTNAGRNCNIQKAWNGTYAPPSNSWRARVIMARIESRNSADRWDDAEWEYLLS
jgi:hypothetical protein